MILDPVYFLLKIKRVLKARIQTARSSNKLTWRSIRYPVLRGVAAVAVSITLLSFGPNQINLEVSADSQQLVSRPILLSGASLPPNITARSAYLIEPKSGFVLYDKHSLLALPPASTTKIATALVALDNYDLDTVVAVNPSCSFRRGESLVGLFSWEELSVRDLVRGMLIASGSDAACALAQNHRGGEAAFVAEMNNLAVLSGLKRTHFTNPIGLDEPEHFSSAKDLILLARRALGNSFLREVVGTDVLDISSSNQKRWHHLENTNELLGEVPGIQGVKTGYTVGARETFVFYFAKGNKEFLGALLGSDDRFADAEALLDWVLSSFVFPQ